MYQKKYMHGNACKCVAYKKSKKTLKKITPKNK